MPQYREFEISNFKFTIFLNARILEWISKFRLHLLDVVLEVPGSVHGSPPVVGSPHQGVACE